MDQLAKNVVAIFWNQSFIRSEEAVTVYCPKPEKSCTHFHTLFILHFNIILTSLLMSPK